MQNSASRNLRVDWAASDTIPHTPYQPPVHRCVAVCQGFQRRQRGILFLPRRNKEWHSW